MADTRPIETIRDGNIKANIWMNQGEKGPFFNITLAKTYKDDQGNYQDTNSFSGTDLLRVAELARTAYTRSNELRRAKYQSAEYEEERQEDYPEPAGATRRDFPKRSAPARSGPSRDR